jgi:hypothetical protein
VNHQNRFKAELVSLRLSSRPVLVIEFERRVGLFYGKATLKIMNGSGFCALVNGSGFIEQEVACALVKLKLKVSGYV